MIVKKVPNPNKSASKAVRIRALAGYIRAPETDNAAEKCLYAGARGFLCGGPEAQTEEMLALARDAPRSRDPIAHYVLSWHADEHPTPAQVEELVDLLLDELGVAQHQVLYGLHADTDNTHLHVMLNRVHPDTLRAVEINGGFDVKALHKACARIEHAQGWRTERGARYRVNAANEVEPIERVAPERMARPPQRVVDTEHRRGERSAARIAMAEAAPLIEAARSWEALHAALARRDMGYVRAGSGAAVRVGAVFVKASTVSRAASRKRLEARLGPYVAPPERDASRAAHRERDGGLARAALSPLMDPRCARALIEAAQSWEALHEGLAAQGFRYVRKGSGALVVAGEGEAAVSLKASAVSRRAALRALEARLGAFEPPGGAHASPEEADPADCAAALEARHAAWARWEEECEEEVRALAERQREERVALRRERCWKARAVERNLHRHLLARAHASEKAALRRSQRRAREALREGGVQDKRTDDPALAFLRRTRHLEPGALEAASETAPAAEALAPRTIDAYQGRALGSWVVYATRAQHARGEVAFVDRGPRVTLHERDSDAAALAAMRLAEQKWGRFRARGSEAHKRRSAWLAAKHHLPLANPELQELIAQYRRELGRDKPSPRLGRRPRAVVLPPPQIPLAEPGLRAPPERAPRVPVQVIRPPQAPLAAAALKPPPRLGRRPRAVVLPPPQVPLAEPGLRAPPERAPRVPVQVMRPPQAPLAAAALKPPPQLTPRATTTLVRPLGARGGFERARNFLLQQHIAAVSEFEQTVKSIPKHQRTPEQHQVAEMAQPNLAMLMSSPQAACAEIAGVAAREIARAMEEDRFRREQEPSVKPLKKAAVRTMGNDFVLTDVSYERYAEYRTAQGPRCSLPVQGRLSLKFGQLSEKARAEVNQTRVSHTLSPLESSDAVTMNMRFTIGNPRSMATTYVRDEAGTRAVEEVRGGVEIDGVENEDAMAFAARKLEDGSVQRASAWKIAAKHVGEEAARHSYAEALKDPRVPTLLSILEDRQTKGGRFTNEEHTLALAETKGRLVAERGNLMVDARAECSWNNIGNTMARAAGMPSKSEPHQARDPGGKLTVTAQGEMSGKRDALIADVGFLPGRGMARVFTAKCTDQRYMQGKVLEAEAAARAQARGPSHSR